MSSRPEERKDAHGDEDVVEQGNDRADGEGKLEPEGDIDEDAENAETERPEGVLRQLAADE